MLSNVNQLLKKDFRLELRKPYVLNGILLHTASMIFLCYLAFSGIIEDSTWSVLFWIILLFSAINAVSKSFVDEHSSRHLYYYSIASPVALVLAKMIYNTLLMLLLAVVTLAAYALFLGYPAMNMGIFALAVLLGSIGFALILTLVAAIASRAGNNFTLMAILSFPVMMPMLLILIRLSGMAMNGQEAVDPLRSFIGLIGLIIVVVVLAVVLYPYLWKE